MHVTEVKDGRQNLLISLRPILRRKFNLIRSYLGSQSADACKRMRSRSGLRFRVETLTACQLQVKSLPSTFPLTSAS